MGILTNSKFEHFAQLIASGKNATEAARTAGYSEKRAQVTGSELLKNSMISVRITELRKLAPERATEKTGVDKAWVMQQLVEVVQMGKAAEPVRDAEGNPIGEYKTNLAAANKALELIGKEFNMFVDRTEVRTGPLDGVAHDDLKQFNDAISALLITQQVAPGSAGQTRH